jgi:hypothetical protein
MLLLKKVELPKFLKTREIFYLVLGADCGRLKSSHLAILYKASIGVRYSILPSVLY